jgi:hypothetical protein
MDAMEARMTERGLDRDDLMLASRPMFFHKV